MLKVAYIAGPYRATTIYGVVENIRRAEGVSLKYWAMGYAVICPHKNTALMDGLLPDACWLNGCLELLRRADVVVMMEGWLNSKGASAEYAEAIRLGKEIIYDGGQCGLSVPTTVA